MKRSCETCAYRVYSEQDMPCRVCGRSNDMWEIHPKVAEETGDDGED